MAIQINAARIHKDINVAQDQQLRLRSIEAPLEFIKLAQNQGYVLNPDDLEAEIANLSDKEIAAIWNPGIGDRRHLVRR